MENEIFNGATETDEDIKVECSTGNHDCANCSLKNYNRNCHNMPIYDTKLDKQELIDLGFFSA
jgi:hypothetical protein